MRLSVPRAEGHRRLLLGLSIDALGSGLFLPFSLLFFTATTDLPLVRIGLALSIAALVRLPATFGAGAVADRLGATSTVVLSAVVQALGFAGYLFVQDFPMLVLTAMLVQVGNSAFWVGYPGLVHDAAEGAAQEPWFALLGALRSSGTAVGSLGASLAVAAGGRTGFLAIALINAMSFAASAVLVGLDGRRPGSQRRVPSLAPRAGLRSWRPVLRDVPFLGFVVVNTGFAVLSLAFFIGVPVFLVQQAGLPTWAPGVLVALNAVLGAVAAVPIVTLVNGRRRHLVLVVSQLIIGAGFAAIMITASMPPLLGIVFALVGVLLITTTELIQGPVVPAVVNDSAGAGDRGRYTSLYQMAFVVGDLITPVLITALLSHGAVTTWLPLVALAGVNAGLILLLARALPALGGRVGQLHMSAETTRRREGDAL